LAYSGKSVTFVNVSVTGNASKKSVSDTAIAAIRKANKLPENSYYKVTSSDEKYVTVKAYNLSAVYLFLTITGKLPEIEGTVSEFRYVRKTGEVQSKGSGSSTNVGGKSIDGYDKYEYDYDSETGANVG
jgi:hypothetical protein